MTDSPTSAPPQPQAAPASPPASATPPASGARPTTMDLLADVEIEVTVELGRRRMSLGEVSRLDVGSVVELDTLAGEPLVLYANGRRIATGEAVVVDGQFGVRVQALAAG